MPVGGGPRGPWTVSSPPRGDNSAVVARLDLPGGRLFGIIQRSFQRLGLASAGDGASLYQDVRIRAAAVRDNCRMPSYRIHSGDTLSAIAARYHISVGALLAANPQIRNANLIHAGASLNLPGRGDSFEPAKPAAAARYTVRHGDTLGGIASHFHTTVAALAHANHLANPNLIYPGQHLTIPPGAPAPSHPAPRPPVPAPSPGGHPSSGSRAFDIARSELGKNAGSLKLEHSAVGSAMEDWVPNNVNCASFVAGCLQAAGRSPTPATRPAASTSSTSSTATGTSAGCRCRTRSPVTW